MKKKITYLLLLILMGCELVVDIHVPYKEELTLNSVFTPDSLFSAQLTLNHSILAGGPFQTVDGSSIIILEDNKPIDTLHNTKPGYYVSDVQPKAGKKYTISASDGKHESISAESSVPVACEIINVEVLHDDNIPNSKTLIKVKFRDDADVADFYEISANSTYESINPFTNEKWSTQIPMLLQMDDVTLGNDYVSNETGVLVKDIRFNGKETELVFRTDRATIGFTVLLRKTGMDYYNYQVTKELQYSTSGNPFAQPVNVFNNISHGFGIFAGYYQSAFFISRPKPSISSIVPMRGKAGDDVLITGAFFGGSPSDYWEVMFRGDTFSVQAQIVRSSDSEIEVIIPEGAITGKIGIDLGGFALVSDTDFVIE
jgi:hypothetical protein